MRRPWWSWAVVPALALTIFGGVASVLGYLDVGRLMFPGADKVLHFLLYGGVAFGAVGWFVRWRGRSVLLVMVLIAVSDELLQRYMPHRSVDVMDAVCSIGGIVVLGVLARLIRGAALSPPAPVLRSASR